MGLIRKVAKMGERNVITLPNNSGLKSGDLVDISMLRLKDEDEREKSIKKLMENLK